MTVLMFVAVVAVALAVGGYIGVRFANASHKLDADIASLLLVSPRIGGRLHQPEDGGIFRQFITDCFDKRFRN